MITQYHKLALTAGFVLATALTFSCSGDDGSDGKPGAQGEPGTTGVQGEPGESGEPGPGCSIATDAANSAYLLITCGSDTERIAKALCGTKVYDPAKQFCDSRDGKLYKFVSIGTGATAQTWMAENLNYNASGSKCGGTDGYLTNENTSICNTYGRLYDWETAKTVCPSSWHLPSSEEWRTLTISVGSSNDGTKLKAESGWNDGGNGTNDYGFSALPGGGGYSDDSFDDVGNDGNWWTATEIDASGAHSRIMSYDLAIVGYGLCGKSDLYSVRCVQD